MKRKFRFLLIACILLSSLLLTSCNQFFHRSPFDILMDRLQGNGNHPVTKPSVTGAMTTAEDNGTDTIPNDNTTNKIPDDSENTTAPDHTDTTIPDNTETPTPDSTETPTPDNTETPTPDSTETPTPDNTSLAFTLNGDGKSYAVSGIGEEKSTTIKIPATYKGLPVTSIGSSAFYKCSSLTSITIPDSVTSIGVGAFSNCSSLTNIAISNSVTSIGDHAFSNCSSLTNITIPDSVTSIGQAVFSNCSSLISIAVAAENPIYHSINNCLIKTKSKTLVAGCKSSIIPTDGSVTSIGDYAFFNCSSLTNITIPNSVTSIGGGAFSRCTSLTSITIPDSVTSIGSNAFKDCSSLTIYCEAESQPDGWDSEWNRSKCSVIWGYKPEA